MNRRDFILATAATTTIASTASAQTTTITGAGATFPRPLYERWGQAAARDIGIQLNYQSIGSGGGINQITARTVDFGASDAPLSAEQLDQRNLLQFPTAMGSVILSYNLPGVQDRTLRLSSDVLADIFLGKVTRWSDPRITQINSGIRIPNLPIGPVYRADGSGTTWIFTNYLARISSEWRDGPGSGTAVRWPAGNGARGNEGVSNVIRNTPGSIGYIENAYAVVNRLPMTLLSNGSGGFVTPNAESFNSAAAAVDWSVPNFAVNSIAINNTAAWPMTAATYILLPKNPVAARVDASRITMRFFDWAFREGSDIANRLQYIPLPQSTHELIRTAWTQVKSPTGVPIWSR